MTVALSGCEGIETIRFQIRHREAGMRHWIWRAALVAALTAGFGARAAEITLSCGAQELEFRLCEEAAAA